MNEQICFIDNHGFPHTHEPQEEIVRCRDCKHYGKPYECWLEETKPDEFCSRGKRKETP